MKKSKIFIVLGLIFFLGILTSILMVKNKPINNIPSTSLPIQYLNQFKLYTTTKQPIVQIISNKKTIINFWAPWCSPCIKEIPMLNKFYAANKDRIQFIGIGIDNQKNIDNFQQKINIDYPISIAGLEGIELAKNLGNNIGALPYTVVLDANGKIISKYTGELTVEQLQEWTK